MYRICFACLVYARSLAAQCVPTDLPEYQIQKQFRELDRKAQVEFRQAEFAKAAGDFRRAACSAPERLRPDYTLYGMAVDALARGDFQQARSELGEADRRRPDYPLALAMLIKINLLAGDMDRLKQLLLDAAHRFPRDYRLHADVAQDLLHANQNGLALAEALRSGGGFQDNARTALNLAILENQAGANSDAASLASSLEERESLPATLRASAASIAGLSFESNGSLEEAVQHLKLAIRLDPTGEKPYLALARTYTAQENRRAAVDVLKEAREHAGHSPAVLQALSSALVASEQFGSAREVLVELADKFPDQLEAYPKLAEAERNLGEPDRATEALERLAARDPDHPMIHTAIAQSLLDEAQVDYPKVFRELDLAERATPEDYDVHYLRGRACFAIGDLEGAVRSFRHAAAIRPEEPRAYYQLGLAYRKLEKATLAREQFEKVEFLKANP